MSQSSVKKAKTRPSTSKKTRKLPPYNVILHNDDVNTGDAVVKKVSEIARLELQDAIEKTKEAHLKGLSLLLTTHKERAELLAELFQACSPPIKVTIEPA